MQNPDTFTLPSVEVSDRTDAVKDDLDKASLLQGQLNDSGIAAARAAMVTEHHPDFDGATCLECGDDMPEERIKAGRIRCWFCQTAKEKRAKRRG